MKSLLFWTVFSKEVVLSFVVGLIAIGGVLSGLWTGWGFYVIYSTERPTYSLVKKLSSEIEIRQYEEQSWIKTKYDNDDGSFRTLASYIFGQNKEKKSVPMTAPVITGQYMAFILPVGLTELNAPQPDGQPIEFAYVSARQLATLRFSWLTSPERVARKIDELLSALRTHGIQTEGEPFLMRYNDPWTPPFMRRNEVAIEVREKNKTQLQ